MVWLRFWVHQNLVALDQLLNALLGGSADETLSSRAWRNNDHKYWGWTCEMINAIFFWQYNHCYQSYLNELLRRQLPREFWDDPA